MRGFFAVVFLFGAVVAARAQEQPPADVGPDDPASLPSDVVSNAPAVVGKSVDPAVPETYALPAASTARPPPSSKPEPPRYVE